MDLSGWRASAKPFAFRGFQIATWEAGSGEPLLLVHGYPTASWDWHKLWAPLARQYRVLALDMLGFGFSEKPPRHPYNLMEQTDLQEAFLQDRGIRRYHALVHDYGVSVGQELLARRHEGRALQALQSMVFLNGGLFPGQHRPLLLQRLGAGPLGPLMSRLLTKKRFLDALSSVFGPRTRPNPAELEDFWTLIDHAGGARLNHRLLRYMHDRVVHKDRWEGALIESELPRRLIDGALDPVSGRHLAEFYLETVPEPDVVILDEVGHYPHLEAADEVLAAYLDFRSSLHDATHFP